MVCNNIVADLTVVAGAISDVYFFSLVFKCNGIESCIGLSEIK